MTPDGLIATASVRLAGAGIENTRGEARLLLAHVLGVDRSGTLAPRMVTPGQAERFETLIKRRALREPLAYIIGHREFWSMGFAVGPGVLVPRPDSETLVEEALRLFPDRAAPLQIGDLGTGSGALLVAVLSEFPNACGIGFEASEDAFSWGFNNIAQHMPARAEVRLADWNMAPENHFDLILSNPPYIPTADIAGLEPEVRDHEPHAALDGGRDGLEAYRALARLLPRLLRQGGFALLEMGIGQAPAMEPLFPKLEILRIASDLAGIPRVIVLKKPK